MFHYQFLANIFNVIIITVMDCLYCCWCCLFVDFFAYVHTHMHVYVHVQVHLKKIEYLEKGQYFLSLISESETHILYRFITHWVKYVKPLFLEMFMVMAYR